ncbi:hypothetical protein K490DRAFT_38069 [Saccharata proteae CBS 121410]|uniref:Zn(2)-C6 fungal-type domain-containing protein n=1 Tax=Saccharata proteae CBS 121410 TaxID=1314787 RepID=A0A6A5YBL6_9PEZI|nr:hypothetical protein K490DRAFT_38069 [Saccharata proteae CBS 121410]
MPATPKQRRTPRRHVTTACLPCRESKIKCDGAQPICDKCKTKGRECRYSRDEDKRRVSLRAGIDILSKRVNQLTQYILDRRLQLPEMEPEFAAELSRIMEVLQLPTAHSPPSRAQNASDLSPPPAGGNLMSFPSADCDFDWSILDSQAWSIPYGKGSTPLNGSNQPIESSDFMPTPIQLAADSSKNQNHTASEDVLPLQHGQDVADEADWQSEDESEDELIKQISVRMGSLQLAQDGQLRYYGPTSNFNLCDFPDTDQHANRRSIRSEGQEVLHAAGVGQTVEPAIEDHLTNLYFAWQDPFFHVVDEAMYRAGKLQWRSNGQDVPYYSEVLTNAICAAGAAFEARYHPSFVTWPKSLAEYFADRSKALLELEMDSPCIATVQALVVLCSHETACKRDARGWLYSGMALRLAFDLGLHLDMTSYVAKGKISAAEAEVRRTTFWGTYIVDHLSGFYYGRPLRINMGDISVHQPAIDSLSGMNSPWIPYGHTNGLITDSTIALQIPLGLITKQCVQLCELMEPLGHVLYGVSDISKQDLQVLSSTATVNILNWKEDLPPILQVDHHDQTTPYLPHVLLLHMLYHQFMIYVHRPYVSKTYIQPSPPQGAGHMHAQQTCISSATAVVELLRLYENRYTFRRMNIQAVSIIFTASLILIFIICSKREGRTHDAAVAHLSVCFRALEELTQSYDSARRTREFLVALQRRWQGQGRWSSSAGGGAKRGVADRPTQAVGQEPKRARGTSYDGSAQPLGPQAHLSPQLQRQQQHQYQEQRQQQQQGVGDFGIDWDTYMQASPDTLGNDFLAQLCSIGPAGNSLI